MRRQRHDLGTADNQHLFESPAHGRNELAAKPRRRPRRSPRKRPRRRPRKRPRQKPRRRPRQKPRQKPRRPRRRPRRSARQSLIVIKSMRKKMKTRTRKKRISRASWCPKPPLRNPKGAKQHPLPSWNTSNDLTAQPQRRRSHLPPTSECWSQWGSWMPRLSLSISAQYVNGKLAEPVHQLCSLRSDCALVIGGSSKSSPLHNETPFSHLHLLGRHVRH